MENQNLNDPSKEQISNKDKNHPVVDEQIGSTINEHAYKEETAAEIVDEVPNQERQRDHDEVKNMYGWIAIALSALSFFLIPILFAGAGIILGFIARNREAPILGNTAIAIGIISIITRLLIIPLI